MTEPNPDDRFDHLRQLAEQRIDSENISFDTLTPGDVKLLFHELQTHQIELEIQNEELRQAQQELQDSRDAYSDLYEFAPVGYATLDALGVITRVNLTLVKMLGATRTELVGKPLTRFIERSDQDDYYRFFRELDAEPGTHVIELRAVTRNHDTPLYIQIHTYTTGPEDRAGLLHRLAFVDVTARRAAESALYTAYNELEDLVEIRTAELRASEARFRLMADSAPVLIWIADEEGARSFVNQTWQDFTGRPIEADTGDGWLELVHPEDVAHVRMAYRNAIQTSRLFRLEYRLRQHDGAYRWVLEVGVPAEKEGFIGSAIDITDRKLAQQRLEKALADSRELYMISRHISTLSTPRDILTTLVRSRYLSGSNRATVVTFDKPWDFEPPAEATIIAEWSANGTEMFVDAAFDWQQYQFYNLCRRDAPVIVPDVSTDPRITPALREQLLKIGSKSVFVYPLVASGDWFGVLILHLPDANSIDTGSVMHIRGLVDQAAAALHTTQQLSSEARARRLAEEANRLKIQFLAMISHELRTPLTSIQGYADTLLMEDVTWEPEQQQQFVEIIRSESENLRELIEQLLDLSRLEAGMFLIDTTPTPGSRIVEQARPRLQMLTPEHALRIETDADLPTLAVDAMRIEQVLTNLVHNAVKFSPPGSAVVVRARTQDDQIVFSVSDEGPGIPDDEHEQVFEAFRQAGSKELSKGGAGLGLAICRGIVLAHGGDIWIDGDGSPGLTVSFSLPTVEEGG